MSGGGARFGLGAGGPPHWETVCPQPRAGEATGMSAIPRPPPPQPLTEDTWPSSQGGAGSCDFFSQVSVRLASNQATHELWEPQ